MANAIAWVSAGAAAPSVALDVAAGSITTGAVNVASQSLTVANQSNRALVILIGNISTLTVSAVAYTAGSGGAWAKLGSIVDSNRELEIWSSVAPSTGSVTAQATFSGNNTLDLNLVLYSVYNVDQTTPLDGYASVASAATLSTTLSSGGMVIGHVLNGSDPGAITVGNEDYNASNNGFWRGAHNSGSGVLTWTNAGNIIDMCNVRKA